MQVTRPTYLYIDAVALAHNVARVRQYAPLQRVIAMVKANAYGCGVTWVAPILEPLVDAFGVACLEEARILRQLCPLKECILFQGIFSPDELATVVDLQLTAVIHNKEQLLWFTQNALSASLKVWVKIDTGMHRLGFSPVELATVLDTLERCAWINKEIGIMTHLACADQPQHFLVTQQLATWHKLVSKHQDKVLSMANSASILGLPQTHIGVIRPGIMIYGVSPFEDNIGKDFGLRPVMNFISQITTIHHYAAGETIGYGATWQCDRPSIIAIVPVGYGDGYPRHVSHHASIWINGCYAPIVGRVSMDMMTVDITDCPDAKVGDRVELWGRNVPIETVAKHAHTIAYELMCQVSQRVIRQYKEDN